MSFRTLRGSLLMAGLLLPFAALPAFAQGTSAAVAPSGGISTNSSPSNQDGTPAGGSGEYGGTGRTAGGTGWVGTTPGNYDQMMRGATPAARGTHGQVASRYRHHVARPRHVARGHGYGVATVPTAPAATPGVGTTSAGVGPYGGALPSTGASPVPATR